MTTKQTQPVPGAHATPLHPFNHSLPHSEVHHNHCAMCCSPDTNMLCTPQIPETIAPWQWQRHVAHPCARIIVVKLCGYYLSKGVAASQPQVAWQPLPPPSTP
jgi:hypothetical protein